jgi:alkylation response protein AidB-like acyl-CoA dehydrogenase
LDAGVDVGLDADREADRAAAAALIAERCPPARVRAMAEAGAPDGPDLVPGAAELGWLGLLVPPEAGGRGGRVVDAAAVAEERGRALQPGPFVPSSVVARALAAAGSAELRATVLPALVAARELASWAAFGPAGDWDPGGRARVVTSDGGAAVVDGSFGLVPDAGLVDWLLVAAAEGDGTSQLLLRRDAPGVTVTSLESLDLTRTLWEVRLDGVEVPASARVGPAGGAGAALAAQLDLAVALALAETVGTMDHLFEWTVAYARGRTAFGRPIGSFQAMKHLLADTSRLLETSKAVALATARALDDDPASAAEVASMAKSYVAEAAVELAHACWQTFGGVAYTWDHDFHLHLRRLTADAALYGDAAWHNERVCTINGL